MGTRCPHGRALVCSRRHGNSDEALGQALCPDCYDYEGAVLFNAGVSELWRRTTIYALRALGSLLDLSAREAARQLRLSYVKVAEFQRRGSVHLHALVRADVRTDEHGDAPAGIDADMVASALQIAARKVSAPLPGADGDRRMAWGDQIDAAVVTDAENGRRRAAAYLAKYATKGSDEHGVLDHRLRTGSAVTSGCPTTSGLSWRRHGHSVTTRPSTQSARSCGPTRVASGATSSPSPGAGRRRSGSCAANASSGGSQREARRGGVASQHCGRRGAEWKYEGSGYLTVGDVSLARNLEDGLRLGRNAFREDEGSGPASSRTRESDASDRFRMSEGRS